MYASNENEFNREDDDWVFLNRTSPTNTVFHGAINLLDHEPLNSNSSSNSSSSSSSSKSDRTDSLSSLSSIEHEHIQNTNNMIEEENHNDGLLLINENREDIFLSDEIVITENNENETTPVINEYDLLNGSIDLSNESISSSSNLRQRTGANVQQTKTDEQHSEQPYSIVSYHYPRGHNPVFVVYGCILLLIIFQIIFLRAYTSQRLISNTLNEEFEKQNQRLNEMKIISIENLEQKLIKQFDEKLQKLTESNHNKLIEIQELYQIIDITQQNLTNTIRHLSNENQELKEQIIDFQNRLQIIEEQISKEKEIDPKQDDYIKSTLDALLNNLIKQTTSIAEDTSINLLSLFEQLSGSISDIVDNRHEFIEESKQKLTDFATSSTAEQVQMTLRRGVENLTSSLRKAQSTYVQWIRSRAKYREQARQNNDNNEEEQKARHPWRWTFQRSHDREQMRHKIPITKKHSTNKESICHSQYEFPVNHICTMKSWMQRFFRP